MAPPPETSECGAGKSNRSRDLGLCFRRDGITETAPLKGGGLLQEQRGLL